MNQPRWRREWSIMDESAGQTLTRIKSLLAGHGLHPKKRFGQNFLHDGNQMQRIIEAASVQPGDVILEVGPGTGALSQRLLYAGAKLLAVEVDRDLQPLLQSLFEPFGEQAELLMCDILAGKNQINPQVISRLEQLLAGADSADYTLVANLPYNVASPLLVNLAIQPADSGRPSMQRGVVMVQKEVADRLAAGPGSKAYGPLGIMVQATCDVELVGSVPPGCFWPRPDVESAVVQLVRLETPRTHDVEGFGRVVHRLFEQRRKQIGAIIRRAWPQRKDQQPPEGIDLKSRPEQLSLEQLDQLAGWLC